MEIEEVFARFRAIKQAIRSGRRSTGVWCGEHESAFRGTGYDVVGVDEWRPGQPLKDVAWTLSLRTYPRRLFRIERMEPKELPVLFVVDLSHSMLFQVGRSGGKADLLLDVLGIVGLTRANMHDPVGLLAFSDGIDIFMKPGRGTARVYAMARQIFERLRAGREGRTPRRTNLSAALEFVAARVRSRHSVYVISDFVDVLNDPALLNRPLMHRLAARHDLVLVFLDDPREFDLRRRFGFVRISNMETGEQSEVAARRMPELRRTIEAARSALQADLKRGCGVDSLVLGPGNHFETLFGFLVKRRVSQAREAT